MKLEFLKTIPTSGEYEEICTNDTGATSWVMFETEGFEKWIGGFGHGEQGISKIVSDGRHVLVVVNGAGYVVDQNTKTVEILKGKDYGGIRSAVGTKNPNLIVCSTHKGYKVIKQGKVVADCRPDWIDGLEFLNQEGSVLKGQMFKIGPHDYWNGISLNLKNFKLDINADIKIDYWGVMAKKEEKHSNSGVINKIKRLIRMKINA